MESKRVVIAVVLSLLVLFVWNWLFPTAPTPPKESKPTVAEQKATDSAPKNNLEQATLGEGGLKVADDQQKPLEGRSVTVKTPQYTAVFNTDGGILTSFILNHYKKTIKPGSTNVDLIGPVAAQSRPLALKLGGEPTWRDANDKDLTLDAGDEGSLTFIGTLGDVEITRKLFFSGNGYLIKEQTMVRNNGSKRITGDLTYTLEGEALSADDNTYNQTRIASLTSSGLDEEHSKEDLEKTGFLKEGNILWGGLESNYFLMALIPPADPNKAADAEATHKFRADLKDDLYRMNLDTSLGHVDPDQEKTYTCDYFLGPKDEDALAAAPNNLSKSVNLGWFDFIAKPLLLALNFIDTYVGNYGVAIIILTIIIKLILWPLSQKSYKSMEQMKKLQPMMATIREKHKDDRQKMNEEMMALYKTYKVNPAGGCFPMLLQIPVFLGLYQALLNSISLRHAAFISHVPFTDIIWLADLSAKDPYYVSPVIMGATMFLQQKMTPSPGDPTQAKIMLFMPVFFTFIFLNFPSGLVIYWLTNNVLSIAQQGWMLRSKKK